MPDSVAVEFVIQGITSDGKSFRPSDWAERLCGVMSAFGGDHRMQYSPYVHPITAAGVKCVVVDKRIESVEPMAYRFLLSFAKDNDLQVRPGRPPERTKLAESGAGEAKVGERSAGAG
jgi:hypothetical protein